MSPVYTEGMLPPAQLSLHSSAGVLKNSPCVSWGLLQLQPISIAFHDFLNTPLRELGVLFTSCLCRLELKLSPPLRRGISKINLRLAARLDLDDPPAHAGGIRLYCTAIDFERVSRQNSCFVAHNVFKASVQKIADRRENCFGGASPVFLLVSELPDLNQCSWSAVQVGLLFGSGASRCWFVHEGVMSLGP